MGALWRKLMNTAVGVWLLIIQMQTGSIFYQQSFPNQELCEQVVNTQIARTSYYGLPVTNKTPEEFEIFPSCPRTH